MVTKARFTRSRRKSGESLERDSFQGPSPERFFSHFFGDAVFLLTVGSFLLTVELFYLQLIISAFSLTIGALSLTI